MKYYQCHICGAPLEIDDARINNPWGTKKFVCREHIADNVLSTVNGLTTIRLESPEPHPINWNCPTHRSFKPDIKVMNVEEMANHIRSLASKLMEAKDVQKRR